MTACPRRPVEQGATTACGHQRVLEPRPGRRGLRRHRRFTDRAERRPVYQDVYRSNGTYFTRARGTFQFHEIHAHYHVIGIAQFSCSR